MTESFKNIDEIKQLFPDEWVLIGNPEMAKSGLNVLSGIVVLHSTDKKCVYYLGKDKITGFKTVTVIYTGVFKQRRAIVSTHRPTSITQPNIYNNAQECDATKDK